MLGKNSHHSTNIVKYNTFVINIYKAKLNKKKESFIFTVFYHINYYHKYACLSVAIQYIFVLQFIVKVHEISSNIFICKFRSMNQTFFFHCFLKIGIE